MLSGKWSSCGAKFLNISNLSFFLSGATRYEIHLNSMFVIVHEVSHRHISWHSPNSICFNGSEKIFWQKCLKFRIFWKFLQLPEEFDFVWGSMKWFGGLWRVFGLFWSLWSVSLRDTLHAFGEFGGENTHRASDTRSKSSTQPKKLLW